ncbi:ubiquinone biosynthesis protein UbiB [Lactobacillus selangorensis]|uniref:Ubiquinone biosynthesis protein UbiB n=1 Tax=Lactobacillus selangorensis TaxID=81857 RepID=A0A0R2FTZ6_9LACO|nr:AarF/UbiB family protein [Lactobacillus selangorensis]KRN28951.1 ubiquinone biosynthesis protein UbiB [Lactobacillus selangorensis]KRN32639.1 ubiquinone biosynthesis protein UbiB [Lactobacillus selangorensis]
MAKSAEEDWGPNGVAPAHQQQDSDQAAHDEAQRAFDRRAEHDEAAQPDTRQFSQDEKKKQKRHRLYEILHVLRRYNVVIDLARQQHPEQVRIAFEKLGPTFIKMGQILSTRTDLITPAYVAELSKLQDNVPADSFQTVKQTIETQTGQPLEENYRYFSERPFASASMGQVHHAILKDGQGVVVKVQHPGIQEEITTDLALFDKAVKLLRYVPEANIINPEQIINELKRSLLSELDTRNEMNNGLRFYQLNNNWDIIQVPRVYPQYSAPKILVNQYMKGQSIKDFIEMVQKAEKNGDMQYRDQCKYIADVLVRNFIKQVFEDGFFHADPHPGNILLRKLSDRELAAQPESKVTAQHYTGTLAGDPYAIAPDEEQQLPDYRLIYLDFGMMGQLSDNLIDEIAQVVFAINTRDNRQIGTAILALCRRTGPVDEAEFFEQLGEIMQPLYTQGLGDIDFKGLLYSTAKVCYQNNLQMNPDITLLVKAFGTLEGTIQDLDPDLSMLEVARPFARRYFSQHFNLRDELENDALSLWQGAKAAPKLVSRMVESLDVFERGHSKLNIEVKHSDRILHRLEEMVNRIAVALILAAVIVGSSLLVQDKGHGSFIANLGVTGYTVALIIIVVFLLSNLYHRIKNWRHRH